MMSSFSLVMCDVISNFVAALISRMFSYVGNSVVYQFGFIQFVQRIRIFFCVIFFLSNLPSYFKHSPTNTFLLKQFDCIIKMTDRRQTRIDSEIRKKEAANVREWAHLNPRFLPYPNISSARGQREEDLFSESNSDFSIDTGTNQSDSEHSIISMSNQSFVNDQLIDDFADFDEYEMNYVPELDFDPPAAQHLDLEQQYHAAIRNVEQLDFKFQPIELKYLCGAIRLKISERHADFALRLLRSEGFIQVRLFKTLINSLSNNSFQSNKFLLCKYSFQNSRCPGVMKQIGQDFICDVCEKIVQNQEPYVSFNIIQQIQIISTFVNIDNQPADQNDPLKIGLHVTCDGIPLSDSSKVSLYPVIIYISNFGNVNVRSKHFVIASFYLAKGSESINYKVLFYPLLQQLQNQSVFMTKWSTRSSIKVVSFIADTPCRAAILNMQQHNGTYPCHKCKIVLHRDQRKQILPIRLSTELEMRNLEEVIEQGNRVDTSQSKEPIQGVKGSCFFTELNFDFLNGTPMEIMHSLFLGVTRRLIKYFFKHLLSKRYRNHVNYRIKYFCLPSKISRQIRSFNDLMNFKSSEFQNILFFYSYFLFKNNLPSKIFEDFMLLSQGTIRLYYDGYNEDDVEEGRQLIDKFLENVNNSNYSEKLEIFNTHALAHLYQDRLRHGPLFYVSAYPYENQLQLFKQQFFSRNKQATSLEKRIKSERILNFKNISFTENFIFSQQINQPDRSVIALVRHYLHLNVNTPISFYKTAKLDHLNLTTRQFQTRKTFDCLVKANEQFHFVIALFSTQNNYFALLQKVNLTQQAFTFTCEDGLSFLLTRLHPVAQLETENFFVIELVRIQKNVGLVVLPGKVCDPLVGFAFKNYILDL